MLLLTKTMEIAKLNHMEVITKIMEILAKNHGNCNKKLRKL